MAVSGISPDCSAPVAKQDFDGDDRWLNLHLTNVQLAKTGEADVLFLGDSHIAYLAAYSKIYEEKFAPLHSLCFGIGGDQIGHLMYRLQNGEINNIKPKIIVVLIGANNPHEATEIAKGITAIAKLVRQKQPQAQLIICSNMPKGHKPNRNWTVTAEVNRLLPDLLKDIPDCHFVRIDEALVGSNGTICQTIMYDFLHLTNEGYTRAFSPVYEKVKELLAVGDRN